MKVAILVDFEYAAFGIEQGKYFVFHLQAPLKALSEKVEDGHIAEG